MDQDVTLFETIGPSPFVKVDGQPIHVSSMLHAVGLVRTMLRRGEGFSFLTLNLDHMVRRRADAQFRSAYARATLVSADGQPVVALARRAGATLDRVTGADLVLPLCVAARGEASSVFLFGATDRTLRSAADVLQSSVPGLDVVGCLAPSMSFDPYGLEAHKAGEAIRRSGARLCFVALPTAKQVAFIDQMRRVAPGIGFVGVGAALDFIAGTQVRAPVALQQSGSEWLWRLMRDPRHMFRRYFVCGVLYLRLLSERNPATRL